MSTETRELDTILTLQYLQSSRRRPVPLNLEQSSGDLSSYEQQPDDSTALQDAAVKSATSLIAVVNDMLRSPPATARFPPQLSSLAPHHGRPRSRTAPSTPLVEAPARPAPVELPGSIPDRPLASYHQSFDGKMETRMSQGPRHEQPRKRARRPSHPWLHLPLGSNAETPKGNPPSVAADYDPTVRQHSQRENPPDESGWARTPLPCGSTAPQSRQSYMSGTPSSLHGAPSHESSSRLPRSSLNLMREDNQHLTGNQVKALEHGKVPLSDLVSLHASHEDHVATIVEAHQRQITSLRMYIDFLEQCSGLSRTSEKSCPELQTGGKAAERHNMELPCDRSSAEASYLFQRNSHHGYIDSTIDTHCTSYAPYGELWLECNHLRSNLESCKRHIAHSEETVSRMQRLELSLKNENGSLRSRLLAANNERMDVQEGLYEACKDLKKLAEREACLARKNEELRRRFLHATRPTMLPEHQVEIAKQTRSGHCRTRSDVSYQHTSSGPTRAQNATQTIMLLENSQRRQTGTQLPQSKQQAQEDDTRRQSSARKSPTLEFTVSSARAVSLTNIAALSLTASTESVTPAAPRVSGVHRSEHLQVQKDGGVQTGDLQSSELQPQDAAFDGSDCRIPQSQQTTQPSTPKIMSTRANYPPTARTPSPSPSLSSSQSSSISSSTPATILPQTPRTVSSTRGEVPPVPTMNPCYSTHARTPPAGVNKRLPKTPPLDSEPLLLPPAYMPVIKREETMKSVGGSIIELYADGGPEDSSGWEQECCDEDKGWVEWV